MAVCSRCAGKGIVLADLNQIGLGKGFYEFMTAGCTKRYDDNGFVRHELMCPRCSGSGLEKKELSHG